MNRKDCGAARVLDRGLASRIRQRKQNEVVSFDNRFINDLHRFATVLGQLPTVDRSLDPNDNFLLAMAEASAADYLVTGDKRDVLALKQHGATHIVTARAMLRTLGLAI